MIEIYCGKGGSALCAGRILRAAALGRRPAVLCFLKEGLSPEARLLEKHGVAACFSFETPQPSEKGICAEQAIALFDLFRRFINVGKYDTIFADELLDVITFGYIGEENLANALAKAAGIDILITGKRASEKIAHLADNFIQLK